MVYKRYVRKNGKVHGPYYYKSYRENGVVKKKYIGSELPKETSKQVIPQFTTSFFLQILIVLLVIVALIVVGFLSYLPIAKVTLNIQPTYTINEPLAGSLNVAIQPGDIIQKDTQIKLALSKGGTTIAEATETFEQFLGDQISYVEITNETLSCINNTISQTREVCHNETTEETIKEVCHDEEILNENNEPIIQQVCNNETTPGTTQEVCTNEPISETTGENCTTTTLTDYYYNTTGTYSKPIESLISYNLDEAGDYVLTLSIPSLTVQDERTFSVTSAEKKVNQTIIIQKTKLKVRDAQGNVLEGDMEMLNNSKGKQDIKVKLSRGPIKSIHFKDVEGTDNLVKIDDIPKEGIFSGYDEVYAIDPTGMNFSDAVVTVNAKGSVLMKCKEWDFDNRVCNGEWIKMLDITPGEDYSFDLTSEDPAFAEINVTSAEHLDVNKNFISNIFPQIENLDDMWSEHIYKNEFVRATYQHNLTNGNIIDIYARNANAPNSWFEVYAVGTDSPLLGTSKIFNSVGEWDYITISNLSQPTDLFDFKIASNESNGSLEFDYIHDASKQLDTVTLGAPTTDPNINVSQTFQMNCSFTCNAGSGNTAAVIILSFQYNSSSASWININTTTRLSTSNTNPVSTTCASAGTNFPITVNGSSAGNYSVRCMGNDTTHSVVINSATRAVTVKAVDNPPTDSLVSPVNGNVTNVNNATFNCSATDDYKLKNITFYWNYSGSFVANGTVAVNGTLNSTIFLRTNLSNGVIKWNCYACDNASQCAFAPANWTVSVNYSICVPNMTNTSWNNWVNLSCVGSQKNQSRFRVQYDSNSCGTISNTTSYEYRFVGPTYYNTTWSDWANISCLIDNTMNQTRNSTQYDGYGCAANQTFYDFRHTEWCCVSNMTNTSWSGWANQGNCKIDDLQLQNRSWIEYDTNNCGTITNVTHWEYKNVSCNYCSYGVVTSNWTDWTNITCLYGDTMNQTRNKTEYDENYSICYDVTVILSDLWNSGNNNTYFEYNNTESCNYCTENILGSFNTSCDTFDSLTQYWTDANYSTCCAVTGLSSDCHINNGSYTNQTLSCNYCTENITGPFNTTCNSSNLLIHYYADGNYSSCCAVTGFISDCSINAPAYANQTLGCQYDTIPPWFNSSNTLPQPNSQYNQTNVIPIVANPSENSIVFANISWASTSQIVNLAYNGTQWYYDSTFTNTTYHGTYTIVINATDISGNSNITATNFTINDITAPVILDISPANGTKFNPGQAINVTANVTDMYYDSVASVIAQLTYPNGTSINYTMGESDDSQIFNVVIDSSALGIHNLTLIANDSSGNSNKVYAWINLTWDDVTPPSITNTEIEPYDPAVDYNISLSMTSTDNIAVSGMFANITLPNGTVIAVQLPSNYTLPLVGRYNVTFWANDSSGNVAAYEDYFVVGSIPVNVTFNVVDYLLGGLPINLTIYLAGTDKEVYMHDFIGSILDLHTDILYDLYFYDSLGNNISVRLNGVNLSLYPNSTLGLDRNFAILGNLVTYGVNSSYGFASAIVRLSYAGTGYSDENSLVLEKCNNWDFTARTCLGSWDDITSQANQNNILHYFEVSTTSFSGFGIKEPAVKPVFIFGGGGGDIVGLSTYLISASVTQGKSSREYLWLNNTGEVPVDVSAQIEGFEGIADLNISLSESNFTIGSGGDKRLAIVFSASKDMAPGVYAGKIIITTKYGRKVVNVFLTVNSPLFDMTIDISPGTRVIEQGGKLNAIVSFYNLGMLGEFDINLTLKIADLDKNIIFTLPQQIIIMGKNQSMIKVAREIAIGNLAPGRYMVLGEARYGNFGAEAYNLFEVRKNYGWIILLLILLELLLLLWLFLRRRHVAAGRHLRHRVLYRERI